jgi:phosphoglycerol transferase MdoB-like AlkP superfamily enzyme
MRVLFFVLNGKELAGGISNPEYGWMLLYGLRADLQVALLAGLFVWLLAEFVRWPVTLYFGRWLSILYTLLMAAILFLSAVDNIYFGSNHRRLAFTDLQQLYENNGLFWPFFRAYWWLFFLVLLLIAGAWILAEKWRKGVRQNKTSGPSIVWCTAIYCLLLFFLGFDFRTRYFFTPSSGYFVMRSELVPYSSNTITELIASRRYARLDVAEWRFMPDDKALAIHPVVHDIRQRTPNHKNVVIFIIESASGKDFEAGPWRRQCMPFLDSLMEKSFVFDNFFANGRGSPAGFDAVIGGIPEGVAADFFRSGYGYNRAQWFPQVLKGHGYSTWFFYGVRKFNQSFLKTSRNFQLDNDFGYRHFEGSDTAADSWYGIYDHVFFPAVARQMTTIKPPFLSVIFNVSTHTPFNLLPQAVMDSMPDFGQSNGRALHYYDRSVRDLFGTIKQQSWFNNTIFLFVGDHFSRAADRSDKTIVGEYRIPMFIFSPDGSFKGHDSSTAQQIDIPPAILDLTGTGERFFSYGQSLFDSTRKHIAFNRHGSTLQAFDDHYLMQYNMVTRRAEGLYRYKTDSSLSSNLLESEPVAALRLTKELQAFWQVFAVTLSTNKMYPDAFH